MELSNMSMIIDNSTTPATIEKSNVVYTQVIKPTKKVFYVDDFYNNGNCCCQNNRTLRRRCCCRNNYTRQNSCCLLFVFLNCFCPCNTSCRK